MRRSVVDDPNGTSVGIRIKVEGGTLADKFLCESCAFGAVMRGPSMKHVQIRCAAMDGPPFAVPFRVVKCNRYMETDSTDLRQMKQEAYYVHKTAHGGCHLVTRSQFDDYDFMDNLEEADKKKATAHPKLRRRTLASPNHDPS